MRRVQKPKGEDITTCRSCGAEIFWVLTQNGKKMPLDAAGVTKAVVDVNELGVYRADVRNVFTPRFATCPDAAKHRRRTS